MGLFDSLVCDHPLPDGRIEEGAVWQTKDGPCDMGLVRITRDGRIEFEDAHHETVPEHEREYYGTPQWNTGAMYRLSGSLRRVVDGITGQNFTGQVYFYRSLPLDPNEWEEYIALFVDGKLIAMRALPETADAVAGTGD
jgi:hypothetical protein